MAYVIVVMKDKDVDRLAEHLDMTGYEDSVVEALLDALPYPASIFDQYYWLGSGGKKQGLHSNPHAIESDGWYRLVRDTSCGWNPPGKWKIKPHEENGLGYYQPSTGKWVATSSEAI